MQSLKETIKKNEGGKALGDPERLEKAALLLKEVLSLIEGNSPEPRAGEGQPDAENFDRLVRLPEVLKLTGMCRSAMYEQMALGLFPRAIKIGPRAASWSAKEVQQWIAQRKIEALGMRATRPDHSSISSR